MRIPYLARGEEVVRVVRRHKSVLFRPALTSLVLVGLLAGTGYLTGPSSGTDAVDRACSGLALVVVARFLLVLRRWASHKILVTDRRIIELRGMVTRRVSSWPYARVHDLKLHRSVGGRLLRYGTLVIEPTTPDAPGAVFERVPDPDGFYRDVMEVILGDPLPAMVEVDVEVDADGEELPWWELEVEDATETGPLPRVVV